MFDIYVQICNGLGYVQEFDGSENDLWNCDIDELPGVIAVTDSELETAAFFQECDRIQEFIEHNLDLDF